MIDITVSICNGVTGNIRNKNRMAVVIHTDNAAGLDAVKAVNFFPVSRGISVTLIGQLQCKAMALNRVIKQIAAAQTVIGRAATIVMVGAGLIGIAIGIVGGSVGMVPVFTVREFFHQVLQGRSRNVGFDRICRGKWNRYHCRHKRQRQEKAEQSLFQGFHPFIVS